MTKRPLQLDSLKDILFNFTLYQCGFLVENCAIALEERGKTPGVVLKVKGDASIEFDLHWTSPDQQRRDGYQDPIELVENGAITITCFLVRELTEYKKIKQARRGGGFDYYLENTNQLDTQNPWVAQIEVSGILMESPSNTIISRYTKKIMRNTLRRNMSMPTYISIVEFNTPQAHFSRFV